VVWARRRRLISCWGPRGRRVTACQLSTACTTCTTPLTLSATGNSNILRFPCMSMRESRRQMLSHRHEGQLMPPYPTGTGSPGDLAEIIWSLPKAEPSSFLALCRICASQKRSAQFEPSRSNVRHIVLPPCPHWRSRLPVVKAAAE
jgi:hypothetical protein